MVVTKISGKVSYVGNSIIFINSLELMVLLNFFKGYLPFSCVPNFKIMKKYSIHFFSVCS